MPILTAISSSAQQLHKLFRCINFSPVGKAQIQITPAGLRISVDHSRVMQGLAFLDADLFTSYRYEAPSQEEDPDSTQDPDNPPSQPTFDISLPALLETLSIFGTTDTAKDLPQHSNYTSGITAARSTSAAFDNRTLGLTGLCRITYTAHGCPLQITLEEGNVTTTCSLTTYESAFPSTEDTDIPFARDAIALKIIMRASLLHDAIHELHATTNPEKVLLSANPASKSAAFSLSATGALGSAHVAFADEPQLLETFQCHGSLEGGREAQLYKFSMVRGAGRAMGAASKVSVRVDGQGVLSLQFMIEVGGGGGGGEGGDEGGGKVSFVDFRFVPFVAEEGDEEVQSEMESEDGG